MNLYNLYKKCILVVCLGFMVSCNAEDSVKPSLETLKDGHERATFAGGCFWCMEAPFEKLEGVSSAVSGYAGGTIVDPTYKQVSSGSTKHLEVVQVTFDPKLISYEELVDTYWRSMDPTDLGGQFADRGYQYSTAIFYHNEEQMKIAEKSKKELSKTGPFKKEIVTPIINYSNFYPAEEYHQDYYLKNPTHYYGYRKGSGREGFLEKFWEKD